MSTLAAEKPASKSIDELFEKAKAVARNAYAEYSHFHVGAALLGRSGKVYTGCNVENVSFPLGTCAEANAIAAARVAEGPSFEAVAIAIHAAKYGHEQKPCAPCGGCRQRIFELDPAMDVHFHGPGLKRVSMTAAELLPKAFQFEPAP